jgi:hypothetical protein
MLEAGIAEAFALIGIFRPVPTWSKNISKRFGLRPSLCISEMKLLILNAIVHLL